MKLTLAEIKNIEQPLKKLMNKELDIKVAYGVAKFLRVINEELTDIEESRIKLVKKFSTSDEKTGQMQVDKEKQEDFFKEFSAFLNTEIEVSIEPIELESLGKLTFTPLDIIALDKVIISKEDKCKKEEE